MKKDHRIKKIVLWTGGILVSVLLTIGAIGFFYWGHIIKVTLSTMVEKESRGLYNAEIGTVYFNLLGGDIYIWNFSLVPDTAVYNNIPADSASAFLLSLTVNNLKVKNIRIWQAIFHKRIEVEEIVVKEPDLHVWRKRIHPKDSTARSHDSTLSVALPRGWDYISAGEIRLQKGNLVFTDEGSDTAVEYQVPSVDIRISGLRIDSVWRSDPRVCNADEINVSIKGIRHVTGNGMYRGTIGETGFSTTRNQVYLKGFHLEPMFDRAAFSRKLGYQTDRMDITIGSVTLSAPDWKELVNHQRLIAEKLRIDSLVLDDYRDKRIPMRPDFLPPMPQQLLRELKTYVWIDTLEVVNGKATYSEQVTNESGMVYFDRISGVLTGLTNDSTWLADKKVSPLKAEAYLQGTGKLQTTINFVFGDKRNRFTVSAQLISFDLTKINPMLTRLVPAEIESGKVQRLLIPSIRFNDDLATGSLTLYYTDLVFKMTSENNTLWSEIKTGVINFVAGDILVHKSNPKDNGKLRSGIVYFQRDKHKSILNFLWKSVLSGLKSNMGFNTKEQKEIKKGKK